jgi:peroxiredoxin Q/BCP
VIREGESAPDFTLHDEDGQPVTLSELRGKPVVLYFYPADDTTGCTKQACGIRDAYGEFQRAGAVVLGVSPDDEASHTKFKAKYDLPFTLLVDADHQVAESYGAWGDKKRNGKTYEGIIRSTWVIAPDGTIAKAMPNVNPETHADQVLAVLGSMQPA